MSTVEQVRASVDGNTDTSTRKEKQGIQTKHYCFTYNNYDDRAKEQLEQALRQITEKFVFGKEVGESGTPHLQGYIHLKAKKRITELKYLGQTIHWEKARNIPASIEYCKKDGDYIEYGFPTVYKGDDLPTEEQLFPWQKDILEMLKEPADDRKIHWFWENKGGVGKSKFCKYLIYHHNAMVCTKGKYGDIMNLAYNYEDLKIMVVDVARNSGNRISYDAIEHIKNGTIYNGKYETGQKLINSPHILIFCNFEPDYEMLSMDRWVVSTLTAPDGA